MSGKLQQAHKKQLEAWIGTGPKDFQLLYSISQNSGYNAQTFHQKCDNEGPTVTVLYNTNNSIFGGYTSVNWNQTGNWESEDIGNWVSDDKAFLFQLLYSGANQYNKFPVKNTAYSIYCASSYGPTFGSGHDLCSFTNYGEDFGGYYKLNGSMNINHSYNSNGIQTYQINNGNMTVTDLEVYKLVDKQASVKTTSSPWRKSLPWKKESLKQLIDSFENYEPPDALKLPETRILMVGPVGAGKSSFFNTLNSIFKGRITQRGYTGSAEHSLTTVYRQYKILSRTTKKSMRFRLCDTRGMEETEGLGLIEFNYLLEGNVPDWYKFDGASPLCTETPGFIHIPRIKDKVHCVMFIFDCSTVDVIPKNILDKIKDMQKRLIQRGVPQTVILTKVDKVSEIVQGDVSKVFQCEKVKNVVDKVSQTLGVPRSNIFPIKNYENETELDQNINILALQALRQVLGFADDYMENYLERMECENIAQMNIKE
ncbi:hypothetical protein CHS0354_039127 [Potamilus streckersoni]|uniref:TLDc domain-containing protein n=1 Tax=Potamilus streckersoni TaxID=2493646 RepID=A0AAE0TIJ3_9BIVA|nr:hypothetical protein CHS0354_039127 [Potamilus streckersoni]